MNFVCAAIFCLFFLLAIGNDFDPEPRYIELKTARKVKKIQVAKLTTWIKALIGAAVAAFVNANAAKVAPLTAVAIFLPLIIVLMIALDIWWAKDGSTVWEMIYFIVLDIVLTLVGTAAACRIFDLTSVPWIQGAVRVVPLIVAILSVAFYISNYISFRDYLNSEGFDEERGKEDEKNSNHGTSRDCCDSVVDF